MKTERFSPTNPLVSVIVPVYNAEKFLRHCLDTLINQTLRNIEIILIDDESTDRSGLICDEYASVDDRIKVVHKVNAGVGAARNTGLKEAKGEYIMFCDSDDFVHELWCEKLFKMAKKNLASLCVCEVERGSGYSLSHKCGGGYRV